MLSNFVVLFTQKICSTKLKTLMHVSSSTCLLCVQHFTAFGPAVLKLFLPVPRQVAKMQDGHHFQGNEMWEKINLQRNELK